MFSIFVISTSSVRKHAKLLIFADDMELYARFSSLTNRQSSRSDISCPIGGKPLGLHLNISKWILMLILLA